MRRSLAAGIVALLLALAACSDGASTDGSAAQTPSATASPTRSPSPPTSSSTATPSRPTTEPTEPRQPPRFERQAAIRSVRHLAGRIGPREATSPAYTRAADWVERRFRSLAYDVTRRPVRVPDGVSWGVPVDAGRTTNIIARPDEYDPRRPYLIVGAHLDTVPQAPGAEDNASGVAVMVELARMATKAPTRLPVVFIAFGGEEPRGEGDDDHHFGSRAYVDRMSGRERRSLRAMVSLDRVGVGTVVPVCIGGLEPPTVRRTLLRTAARIDVPAEPCENRASDHWSFDKAGLPSARIGSTPYAEYHSPADRPRVVQLAQLARVGRIMWQWLR